MKREQFGSRLGFILVSAGCAIGLGNVWKFPYMAGKYGGAAFILVYLLFLVILGLPIIVCEFSVGRASQKSIATSYNALEPPHTRWHYARWAAIAGNYLLVMFYSMVGGWMLYYCFRMAKGEFASVTASEVSEKYTGMLSSVPTLMFWTVLVIVLSFGICSIGLQKGVEKIMKITMLCLLGIMVILTIRSVTLTGSSEGLRFFLVPDFERMAKNGIGNVIFGAMSQAFFTLSIGMGGMAIFGSYLDKKRSLAGESLSIVLLDTCVALMAGLIVIPSCFAFGTRCRTGPCIHHAAEHFHTDGRRTDLGLFILPVFILCGTVHHCRSLREHCLFLDGSVWMEENQSRGDQYSPDHSFKYSMYPRIQRMVRFPAAWRRHKHYGSGRLYCIQQYPSARLSCISFVLYAQKRMGLEKFHSGSKQRRRLKVSGKSSLLYDTYPAVGRSRDLSERLLRHVPPAGNDYFCDLDADRTGLSWIYRIYFQQPEKTEKIIKNWYRQVLFHTADTSTFLSFYLFSKRRSARIHIACTMIAA